MKGKGIINFNTWIVDSKKGFTKLIASWTVYFMKTKHLIAKFRTELLAYISLLRKSEKQPNNSRDANEKDWTKHNLVTNLCTSKMQMMSQCSMGAQISEKMRQHPKLQRVVGVQEGD